MFFPKKMPNSLTSCFDLKKSFCQQIKGWDYQKLQHLQSLMIHLQVLLAFGFVFPIRIMQPKKD